MQEPLFGGEWMARAACAGRPLLPWLTDEADCHPRDIAVMRAVCAGCPVRVACQAYAAGEGICGGWWAGTDRDTFAAVQDPLPLDIPTPGRRDDVELQPALFRRIA